MAFIPMVGSGIGAAIASYPYLAESNSKAVRILAYPISLLIGAFLLFLEYQYLLWSIGR
jgi:hypothetical protein